MTTTAIQVQAGWYPDPLATTVDGTPTHRRWWDGAQWTEHVEPLQVEPLHVAESPRSPEVTTGAMAFAREYDEVQQRANSSFTQPVASPGFSTTAGSAPVTLTPSESAHAAHRMSLHSPITNSAGSAYSASPASSSSASAPFASVSSAVDVEHTRPRRRRGHDRASVSEPAEPLRTRVHTASVWLMATMPFTQALLIYVVFTSLPPESSAWTRGLTIIFPFILYAALAGQDTRLMALAGHLRTAPWVTALLLPPVYIGVRSVRIGRTTGAMAWPLYVWLLAQATVVGTWWAVDPAGVMAFLDLFI